VFGPANRTAASVARPGRYPAGIDAIERLRHWERKKIPRSKRLGRSEFALPQTGGAERGTTDGRPTEGGLWR
jgi:hypothetical protein